MHRHCFQLIIGPLSFGLNVYLFVTTLAYEELRDIKYFHVALMTLCEIIFLPCQWIRTVYRVSHSLVQEQDYHNAFYEYLGLNALSLTCNLTKSILLRMIDLHLKQLMYHKIFNYISSTFVTIMKHIKYSKHR